MIIPQETTGQNPNYCVHPSLINKICNFYLFDTSSLSAAKKAVRAVIKAQVEGREILRLDNELFWLLTDFLNQAEVLYRANRCDAYDRPKVLPVLAKVPKVTPKSPVTARNQISPII